MMVDIFVLISSVVEPFAFIMAVVLIAGILRRKDHGGWLNTALMTTLFSVSVVLSMSDKIDLGLAGIYDLRGLLIGGAIALFGPVVGVLTLLAGVLMRLYLGGPGMFAGTIAMLLAFGGGLFWRRYVRHVDQSSISKGVYLGALISVHVFALFLLPSAYWGQLFAQMAPFFLSANIVGAILFHSLLRNEIDYASEIETLKADANTDPLTGLLNRRGLSVLAPTLTRDSDMTQGRALLCLDIDEFKDANDTYGHAAGDAVLRLIIGRVAAKLRRNDVFARLGGDEFVIVLPDVSYREAATIAERCREAVAGKDFTTEDASFAVSISVGAVWQKNPSPMKALLRAADAALYQAKSQGRDKVVFLSDLDQKAPERQSKRTMLAT